MGIEEQYEEQFVGPKQFKRKNTKKWCKGKKGREHKPTVEFNRKFYFVTEGDCGKRLSILSGKPVCYHHVVCENCGKELQWTPDICPTTGLARKDRVW